MKKLTTFIIVLIVLASAGYLIYQFYLPKVVANALTSDDGMKMMPLKVKEEVEELKVQVSENMDKLPQLMEESKIEYEDLITIIDEADPDQFIETLEELKLNQWETADDAFDIAMKNIDIDGYDLEKFRTAFKNNASKEKIAQWVSMVEENELLTSLSIPMAKEIAKRVLESKKEEIIQELE